MNNDDCMINVCEILFKPLPVVCCFVFNAFKVKKVSGFWYTGASPQTRASAFLMLIFFLCCETMFNCSQNCWIDWNSAVLCSTLSHRGMNVCLICEASLSHHTLYMGNLVPAYTMYHVFPCWQKREKDFEE